MSPPKHMLPLAIGIALMLSGCGTFVPQLQENPWNPVGGQLLVEAIVKSIRCELNDAVTYVINEDAELSRDTDQPRQAAWLLDWGAQLALTLTVDEQTTASPSGMWTNPIKIFFLLGGASGSSTATRIDTLNYFYPVNDIYNIYGSGKPCNPDYINHTADTDSHPIGSLLIQSDLKLKEWLATVVLGVGTGEISVANKPIQNANAKNAISHEVKFQILTSGNITPQWKLVRATINPNQPLFSTSRTRTHDFLITFGPIDPVTKQGLAPAAANANLASQIGLAISNQLINNVLSSPSLSLSP